MTVSHAFEAKAFWDYSSKFKINDNEIESLFNDWAESKKILAEDKAIIWRIIEEHIQRKTEGNNRKRKGSQYENKTSEAINLPRQFEFDFLK